MIYENLLKDNKNSKTSIINENKIEDEIELIIFTEVKLTSPIHFINESKKKSSNNKDDNKDQEEDIVAAKINLQMANKKINCKIHIRNKKGCSYMIGAEAEHGPSIKFIKKQLTDSSGVPILIESNTILEKNVDPKVIREIKNKYGDIFNFVDDNKEELLDIWEIKNQDKLKEVITEMIKDEKNKKYGLTILGN